MPVFLLFGILLLVAVVTAASLHIERLALRGAFRQHRFRATALLVVILAVVGVLETSLRAGVLAFSVPQWLYWLHLCVAAPYIIMFFAKACTASPERRDAHARLTKFYWFFWIPTGITAIFIGFLNVAANFR